MRALVASMVNGHPARPVVIVSNNADAGGIAWARAHGLATEVVDHRRFAGDRAGFERELARVLEIHRPDLICLAGFMRVLTADFITPWKGRMLNIHPSLLPKYRGLDTHARVLAAGDAEHGCTVHEVTAKLDDGPILGQARVRVFTGDTAEDLAARVLEQEQVLYPLVLARFAAGDRTPVMLG